MRNRKFALKFVIIAALALAVLPFNWDRVEMENRAFAIAMGIDTGEGEKAPFKVYLSVIDAPALEEGGGEDAPKILYEAEGATLSSAMSRASSEMSDRPYYGHTKTVIISETALMDARKVQEITRTLSENEDINIRTIIMATDKPIDEILQAQPKSGNLLGIYLSNFYNSTNASTPSEAIKTDLEGWVAGLRYDGTAIIPKITLKDDGDDTEILISGVVALRDYARLMTIPEDYLIGHLLLTQNVQGMELVVDGETLQIAKSTPKLSFEYQNGKLLCHAKVKVYGELVGTTHQSNNKAKTAFTEKIEQEITKTHHLLQTLNIDALHLSQALDKHHPDLPQKPLDQITLIPNIVLEIKNTPL